MERRMLVLDDAIEVPRSAWERIAPRDVLLMDDEFERLRRAVYREREEGVWRRLRGVQRMLYCDRRGLPVFRARAYSSPA